MSVKKKPVVKKQTVKTTAKKVVAKKSAVKKKAATKKKVTKKRAAPRKSAAKSEVSARERYEMIATMAFYRAEKRSFAPGYEMDDWYECEQIIDRMLKSQ